MKETSQLEKWESSWDSKMGGWFPGKKVILRGKNIFTDLKYMPMMTYLIFGITGKKISKEQNQMYEALVSLGGNFPEPRLWNNRIATLAGTARSTSALGASAGLAVSEATIYGHRPFYAVSLMLYEIKKRLDNGENLEKILQEKLDQEKEAIREKKGNPAKGKNRVTATIPGFGRPVTDIDERLIPLYELLDELNLNNTPFLNLITDIQKTLKEKLKINRSMNIAAFACAFSADQGHTPRQIYQIYSLAFGQGILLCNVDSELHPEGSFFPMRCSSINYLGPPPRKWKD